MVNMNRSAKEISDEPGEPEREKTYSSISSILHKRAVEEPARLAFRFLSDGTGDQAVDWTYRDLAEHAAAIAAELRRYDLLGRRVILALDPGLHYVAALFGILQAGATAVPAFPPAGKRVASRFRSIVLDCGPDVVIADPRLAGRAGAFDAELPADFEPPRWLFVDDSFFTGRKSTDFRPVPHEPALLQYTSGSTGDPKGIILSHGNVVSNCAVIEASTGIETDRVGCTWLPPYHDMGLLGTIMLAVHGGWPLVLLSPAHFVQQPHRWLKAISDHRATISVGPNFAFDLCVSGIDESELAGLDLGSLRQLFCGAEPVSPSTLERFRERFAPCGYDETALIPCYGLAEATLFVSGKPAGTRLRSVTLDKSALESGIARMSTSDETVRVMSCGTVAAGHEVVIADPATGRETEPGRVGEIWVHGPNVAMGYFGRPEPTAETFAARLPGRDRTYLRTGDLGFLLDGELFVTGRIKDLIVIAGRNLYPQDIERTVLGAHHRLRESVAFSIADSDGERVVVVAEFRGTARQLAEEGTGLREAVVAAVTAEHGVRPSDVHLAPVGAIPITTSGKVRRRETRAAYVGGTLKALDRAEHSTDRAATGALK